MTNPILNWTLATATALFLIGCATVDRPAPTPQLSAQDRILQRQIFLDSVNFGPGVVDGKDGEFTRKALEIYRRVMGREPDTASVIPYTTYVLTAEDRERIGSVPSGPEAMAKQPRLPYANVTELVAERYHTTQNFLRRLNPGINVDAAPTGTTLRVPNVAKPLRVSKFTSAYPPPPATTAATRRVTIDTSERLLRIIDGDKLSAVFPITPGSATHPAPLGEWKILGLKPWPWFRWDEGVLDRGERTATAFMIPPGVNNPVGILWAGLDRPGTGIHGTPSPETIGRSGSHGCIRLANWDAATFYTLVPAGTPVSIR